MNYILETDIQLKKWMGGRSCYMKEGLPKPFFLKPAEYVLLKQCDGETDLEPNDTLRTFEAMYVISRCEKGERKLLPGQIREYPNYRFRNIDWTITERCNYNCLHCFHAADNNRHKEEFSLEDALRFLEEAAQCGVYGIRLTGGEPTLYPHFRKILEEIRSNGLALSALITNGAQLDEELLGFIKELHPHTQIMLSFDGIGTHDWLRQQEGSEEQVKRTIRLCKQAGFNVKINMNLNRRSVSKSFESVQMLVDMGVNEIRIIKTTEAPRWQLNAADDSLTIGEYYDFSVRFAGQYRKDRLQLPVTIWQSLYLNGKRESFTILPIKSSVCDYNENSYICNAMMNKISVQANGDIIPCAPLAGLYTALGIKMGNVIRDGLQKVFSEGPLIDSVMHTVKDRENFGGKCAGCEHFKNCQGGCPALSMLFGGSLLAADDYKCAFYEGGYYDKICTALDGWKNVTPL